MAQLENELEKARRKQKDKERREFIIDRLVSNGVYQSSEGEVLNNLESPQLEVEYFSMLNRKGPNGWQ
ncbi:MULTISPECIES: Fur-regulated basic protein FbpA [unclassified Oceanobacillus]|uniref:Fur-regulated basic protein FbpA n=1 Tax=unclassified Oceanobacillus TaxID=2630292 RepID=UPI001BE82E29|nr:MULTISPECIES: Fur-regulated basic protein FbpA [unclassified Oceanobacillus]MBT2601402.1 Fur-regulated basic protein FbpA [Oceanobacillus sp. ISL-74]MBT2653322.1 Fur-regulated basic protein FbpA [Oceanobacillus sp. ISL-73]